MVCILELLIYLEKQLWLFLLNKHYSLSSSEQLASIASPKNSTILSRKLQNHEISIKNYNFFTLCLLILIFIFKVQSMPTCKFLLHNPKSLTEAETLI